MTTRYFLLLVLCTTIASGLSATGAVRATRGISDLTASSGPEPTQVWVVFRAPDCTLSADLIEALNRIDKSSRVKVTAVMVDPPERHAEAERLSRALGIRFRILYDANGEWKAALRRERQASPFLYLRDNGVVVGGVSPAYLRTMARLSLSSVPLERTR